MQFMHGLAPQIPRPSRPLSWAVARTRADTGHYERSLAELAPKLPTNVIFRDLLGSTLMTVKT